VKKIDDLNPTIVKQIEAFFVNYQRVRQIAVKILAHNGPEKAVQILRRAALQKHAA
jgi:inorganic pyrophosphatase